MHAKRFVVPIITLFILCGASAGFAGSWVSAVLDIPPDGISGITPNYGGISDIAIDSSGSVHLTHSDGTRNQQRYVTNSTGVWSEGSVDGYASSMSSLVIDSKDQVHIYSLKINAEANLELVHATVESNIWRVRSTVIDTTPIKNVRYARKSILMDGANRLHVAYIAETNFNNKIVKYATNSSGSWTTIDVFDLHFHDPLNISIPSMVLDSARKAHIAFVDNEFSIGYTLKYATNISGEFISSDVLRSSHILISPSVALDKYSRPAIAFMGVDPVSKNGFLRYALLGNGVWAIKGVDSFVEFAHSLICTLLIDSRSKAHISYEYITDTVNAGYTNMYAIKYASNAGDNWQTSFIDNDPAKGFVDILFSMKSPSMAMDSSDNVYVSYNAGYGNVNSYLSYRLLKYATNLRPTFDASGKWRYTTANNWYGGAAGCVGDRPETVTGHLSQVGSIVTGVFSGKTSRGYSGGTEYELYVKFPEVGGGVTKLLTYLTITSTTAASGTMLWFWDGDRPCMGGNSLTFTKLDGEAVVIDYPEPENQSPPLLPFNSILLRDR